MRIIRFIDETGRIQIGEDLRNGSAQLLAGSIAAGFQRVSEQRPVNRLLAPLIPTDIICIGRNYRAPDGISSSPHTDADLEVFLKPSTALQNPNDPILIPRFDGMDMQLDCEGELAIVIGRTARNVSEADALDFVFGYALANDVTARCFQTAAGPPIWMRGKGFDTFCPLGPAIVTADEVSDPDDLDIQTSIDGRVTRRGNTRQLIRSVPQIVATLSRHLSVPQAAVILTGAPAPSNPGKAVEAGSRVAIRIDQLDLKLENSVTVPAAR